MGRGRRITGQQIVQGAESEAVPETVAEPKSTEGAADARRRPGIWIKSDSGKVCHLLSDYCPYDKIKVADHSRADQDSAV